jgi:hypothetical protein
MVTSESEHESTSRADRLLTPTNSAHGCTSRSRRCIGGDSRWRTVCLPCRAHIRYAVSDVERWLRERKSA